ncbi:MAG: VanW family protein [Candidatus Levybacteria bacterium]|nr:VanW family protein [Candidatus Levybacteria bacterium]
MKKKIVNIFSKEKKKIIKSVSKSFFWFLIGAILGLFFLISFTFIFFQNRYKETVYPGVMINGVNFGGKSQSDVKSFFAKKNTKISDAKFVFLSGVNTATISAKQINLGYNEELLSQQAYDTGRSENVFSNISIIFQAYISGINLQPSYRYSEDNLLVLLKPITEKLKISPIEALFTFQNGKVSAFRTSEDGQDVDMEKLENDLKSKLIILVAKEKPQTIRIFIPVKIIKPEITTDKANNLGIKELIGTGTSLFQHSIPNRIFNVTLASIRLNGILVAPDEVFSFNKALGDVSSFTGYQQAYIIQNGRTVLGDGGGVCQVSTTLFRAVLNAGLPVMERSAHAYRVGYYEQDSGPGIDATVYAPSVDFKFENDTGNYILIQTFIEPDFQRLTFKLYGTSDGRESIIDKPVILSQSPPLEPLYQDDPTLPKGQVKQVDFPASGANVYFTRKVIKNGKTIISDKFVSNYRPWQAIYLRGTKE